MTAAVDQHQVRINTLQRIGNNWADGTALDQVLRYCENPFINCVTSPAPVLPLADEAHIDDWRRYAHEADESPGVNHFVYLQQRLPQLSIPITEGISKSPAYAAVVRRGRPFDAADFGGAALALQHPEAVRLSIYDHPAGALPVITTPHRQDFETLDRALASRSEPAAVNPSVNAHLIAGLINWDRVRRYQAAWSATHPASLNAWPAEMARVASAEKWRFYDRLMLVCENFYSGVGAAELGFDDSPAQWLARSTTLRLEHEFTHYTTKRVYGVMRLNMLDETICDWAGMTAALGRFEADWFLRFSGLARWPELDPDGRIFAYREGLNDAALELLCALLVRAAEGLAALTRERYDERERSRFVIALTRLTLELLADTEREAHFERAYSEAATLLRA